MTLIEELMLSMIIARDLSQGGVLFYCVPNRIQVLYYRWSPTGLRHANRARRSMTTTLFRVQQERELFAPLYSTS